MKICIACEIEKPLDQFTIDRSRKDGLDIKCKPCKRVLYNKWYRGNKKAKLSKRRSKWLSQGIDPDLAESMIAKTQSCEICKTTEPGARGFVPDHDHETGIIRGILCGNCNRALGWFHDDVDRLKEAIAYLRRSYEQSRQ